MGFQWDFVFWMDILIIKQIKICRNQTEKVRFLRSHDLSAGPLDLSRGEGLQSTTKNTTNFSGMNLAKQLGLHSPFYPVGRSWVEALTKFNLYDPCSSHLRPWVIPLVSFNIENGSDNSGENHQIPWSIINFLYAKLPFHWDHVVNPIYFTVPLTNHKQGGHFTSSQENRGNKPISQTSMTGMVYFWIYHINLFTS